MPLVTSDAPVPPTAEGKIKSNWIQDVTIGNFMTEVMDTSAHSIVVASFWSARDGCYQQLIPMLEKVVLATKGAARLAKIDVDKNRELVTQLQVQSVPTILAFFQGQPVDGFAGMLPLAQIKSWLDRLLAATANLRTNNGEAEDDEAAAIEQLLAAASEYLAAGDVTQAQAAYATIAAAQPDNRLAAAGLLRCLLTMHDNVAAMDFLSALPPEMAAHKDFDFAHTALALAAEAASVDSSDEVLKTRLASNADDHQARFDLALLRHAAGLDEEAVDLLLEIVRRQRSWNDDAARKQLVRIFETRGFMDPLTMESRKRLSSIMFA